MRGVRHLQESSYTQSRIKQKLTWGLWEKVRKIAGRIENLRTPSRRVANLSVSCAEPDVPGPLQGGISWNSNFLLSVERRYFAVCVTTLVERVVNSI